MNTNIFLNTCAQLLENRKRYNPIISSLPLYNDEPKLFQYHINYTLGEYQSTATGISFNRNIALIKVFAETIERLAISPESNTEIIISSYLDVDKFFLDPGRFIDHVKDKKKLNKLREILSQEKLYWVKGHSLTNEKVMYIPEQIIYFRPRNYNIHLDCNLITTGTAFGESRESAIYKGLCEIVERDAFFITYLNKLNPPFIDIKDCQDNEIKKFIAQCERYNLEYKVLDTTTDLEIPSIAVVVIDKTGLGPCVAIGLSAGYDIKSAVTHAFEEALMVRSWQRDLFYYSTEATRKIKASDITTIEERAGYWFPKKMLKKINFLLASNKKSNLRLEHDNVSLKTSLDLTIKKIKKVSDAYYVDITPSDVKSKGFFVVKVVAPELLQGYALERFRPVGLKRLYKAPVSMGIFKKPLTYNELNKIPHPFL